MSSFRACGQDVEHGLEALDRARWRAGRVEDQRLPAGAGGRARQPAERAHEPHRLGQPRRLAVEDVLGALGRVVARGEAGAARRDDEPREPVGQRPQGVRDGRPAVLADGRSTTA